MLRWLLVLQLQEGAGLGLISARRRPGGRGWGRGKVPMTMVPGGFQVTATCATPGTQPGCFQFFLFFCTLVSLHFGFTSARYQFRIFGECVVGCSWGRLGMGGFPWGPRVSGTLPIPAFPGHFWGFPLGGVGNGRVSSGLTGLRNPPYTSPSRVRVSVEGFSQGNSRVPETLHRRPPSKSGVLSLGGTRGGLSRKRTS